MNTDVFLDTNVLLDVLLKRQAFLADSTEIWNLCEQGTLTGFISVISFNNTYYVARKFSGKRDAEEMLITLRDLFTVVPLDATMLHQAIAAGFNDFEDAIQYQSALRAGATALITRNVDHFPGSNIVVLTPRDFLASRLDP